MDVTTKENTGRTSVLSRTIGRWSTAEHDLFLQGLQKYGKDWKAIANEVVGNRFVFP